MIISDSRLFRNTIYTEGFVTASSTERRSISNRPFIFSNHNGLIAIPNNRPLNFSCCTGLITIPEMIDSGYFSTVLLITGKGLIQNRRFILSCCNGLITIRERFNSGKLSKHF